MSGRKQAESIHHHKYDLLHGRRSENGLFWECVYCGDPATVKDHCPPISRVDDYKSLGLKRESYFLVSSCEHCNGILSDSLQESIFKRIEEAKDLLEKKFKKSLSVPEWDEDEIQELGKNLRSKVRAQLRKASKARRRIDYYAGYEAIQDFIDIPQQEEQQEAS